MHPNDAVRHAEGIRGWMTREELAWLARTAADHHRILEIGTYAGRSTTAMAHTTPGTILTIDTWRGELGTPELTGESLMQEAYRNLRPFIDAGTVEIRGLSSAGLFSEWRHGLVGQFDMFWIDGNHDTSEVMFDLWVAKILTAPGGIICGHDWSVGGVIPALERELPDAKPVANSIWAWEVPG